MNRQQVFVPDWDSINCVIFDIDGTLYSQIWMRLFLFVDLAIYYTFNISRAKDILIILSFRKARELIASEGAEYCHIKTCKLVANTQNVSTNRVAKVVDIWINQRPLKFLKFCRFRDIDRFLAELSTRGKQLYVLSDYPIGSKLEMLGFGQLFMNKDNQDWGAHLKPHRGGFDTILATTNLSLNSHLLIGDSHSRDALVASEVGIRCLIKNKTRSANTFYSYKELLTELNLSTT